MDGQTQPYIKIEARSAMIQICAQSFATEGGYRKPRGTITAMVQAGCDAIAPLHYTRPLNTALTNLAVQIMQHMKKSFAQAYDLYPLDDERGIRFQDSVYAQINPATNAYYDNL
jgi:hypothetical protein